MDKLSESVPAFNKFKNILEKDLKDDTKPWTKWLSIAEEKTGVNRVYLFGGKNSIFYNFALDKKGITYSKFKYKCVGFFMGSSHQSLSFNKN